MSKPRQVIPLDPEFFCDGHYYVLTSMSLGGSDRTPAAIAAVLGAGDEAAITALLQEGICLPLFFDGDCALDGMTQFVIGDLTESEERDWMGKLTAQLNIPCGKLVVLCGGGDPDEFAVAISGASPDPDYVIFQVIDVPPGAYCVEIYAYLASLTVQLSLADGQDNAPWPAATAAHHPEPEEVGYIIRLSPWSTALPLPALVPEIGWCGQFEWRQPDRPGER
ncbi:MAG TPA: hypothetical protein V6D02_10125 [Candidatus Obscuribacterales bacterium]